MEDRLIEHSNPVSDRPWDAGLRRCTQIKDRGFLNVSSLCSILAL